MKMRIVVTLLAGLAIAALSPSAKADLKTATVAFTSGNWKVLRDRDTMTDKTDCTGIYRDDYGIQLTAESLYIRVSGGLESVTLRFGDEQARPLRLPTEMEKKVRVIILTGTELEQLQTVPRLRYQASTLVSGIKTGELDLTGFPQALENIRSGCPSAQTQPAPNSFPLTLKTFSQAALVGLQLSIRKGQQEGKVPSAIANCVASLSSDSFNPVYEKLVAEALTPREQETTEAFFGSAVGKKSAKHGVLQGYTAIGAPLPEPLPTFSQTEMSEIEAFSKTSAGGKLLLQKVLQTPAASRMMDARINELLSGCGFGR